MNILHGVISIFVGLNAGFVFSNYKHKTATLLDLAVAIILAICWIMYNVI